MKILVIDNYDSFTYNLVHYLEEYCETVDVIRNDAVDFGALYTYQGIVLSPGPGLPKDAGQLMQVISKARGKVPILGICLGLQAIVEGEGGDLMNLSMVKHGVESNCLFDSDPIFDGVKSNSKIGHYHSWVANNENLPAELKVIARNDENYIMAVKSEENYMYALQFHPESILTKDGKLIIRNWINSIQP